MIPILYEKHKTVFTNDRIGFLTDAISCFVQEERNDEYELEMAYPINGKYYADLEQDAIIKAKPNNQDDPQPFRIYKIVKQTEMVITVYARHIVYDLSKVTVEPFETSGTIEDAIAGMIEHSIPSCGFIFDTDKTTAGNYKVAVPSSFRALMGGSQGSLLDAFGTAEYHYDGYNIDLMLSRGSDNGVTIRYGVSMIDMEQEEECDNVFTAVFPYWLSGSEYVSLDERIVSVPGQFPFSKIMTLDLSQDFDEKPTQQQLRDKTVRYIAEENIGVPTVSLEVNFSGTEAERDINLCDIVNVEFEKYGVTASAKCISLTYDVLSERVTKVKLGHYKNTFIDTVVDQMNGITEYTEIRPTDIEYAIRDITENEDGYVLLHSSTNTSHIDEILILSGSDNLRTVSKIWRWNSAGLGYSQNGYNGPFQTAIDMAGRIVATMIKTGTLRAIKIRAGQGSTFPFVVESDGTMTAKLGYIGDSTTGFRITDNEVKNTMVKLFQDGFCLTMTDGTEIGIVGKTDMEMKSNIYDRAPWLDPIYVAVHPGIGMFMKSGAGRISMCYWDSSQQANYLIMYYPGTVTIQPSGRTVTAFFFGNHRIEMNGHGFYGKLLNSGSTGTLDSQRIYKYKWFPYENAFCLDSQGVGFNQCYLLDWATNASSQKYYYGIFPEGVIPGI